MCSPKKRKLNVVNIQWSLQIDVEWINSIRCSLRSQIQRRVYASFGCRAIKKNRLFVVSIVCMSARNGCTNETRMQDRLTGRRSSCAYLFETWIRNDSTNTYDKYIFTLMTAMHGKINRRKQEKEKRERYAKGGRKIQYAIFAFNVKCKAHNKQWRMTVHPSTKSIVDKYMLQQQNGVYRVDEVYSFGVNSHAHIKNTHRQGDKSHRISEPKRWPECGWNYKFSIFIKMLACMLTVSFHFSIIFFHHHCYFG